MSEFGPSIFLQQCTVDDSRYGCHEELRNTGRVNISAPSYLGLGGENRTWHHAPQSAGRSGDAALSNMDGNDFLTPAASTSDFCLRFPWNIPATLSCHPLPILEDEPVIRRTGLNIA